MNARIDVNQKNLDRVVHWITAADTKASGLLAIWAITATGFGATIQYVVRSLPNPLTVKAFVVIALAFGYALSAIYSLWRLLSVIYPRERSLYKLSSPLYGESIANLEESDYLKALNKLTEEEIAEHIAKQTWRMQQVCSNKYSDLERSRKSMFLTIVLIFSYLIMSGFIKAQ